MANYYRFVFLLCYVGLSLNFANSQVINVSSIMTSPYLLKNDEGKYIGFVPDILNAITASKGLKFNIIEPADNRYGSWQDNGTWTGMMADVVEGRAEMAGLLTSSAYRVASVDFSYPTEYVGPAIVLRKPETARPPLKESITRLLVPLEFSVWLMTVLAFLVTSTVLYIISHFNPYEWRRMAKDKEATLREAESFTCLNSFWFVISTLAWQGYLRAPRSMGGRITVTAWWFFVLIFLLSYTASLTNMLRVGPNPMEVEGYSKIQSFEDLANNPDVAVGIVSGGSTMHHFKSSTLPEYQVIYEKSIRNGSEVDSADLGVEKLRSREFLDFALILESTSAKYHINRVPCDLFMLGDQPITKHTAFVFKKGSTILNDFNQGLMALHENGDIARFEKRWFQVDGECDNSVYKQTSKEYVLPAFYQMDLGTFSGAILILAVGIVFGGLVSIVEFAIYKWAELHPDEEDKGQSRRPFLENNESALGEHDLKKGGATQV